MEIRRRKLYIIRRGKGGETLAGKTPKEDMNERRILEGERSNGG